MFSWSTRPLRAAGLVTLLLVSWAWPETGQAAAPVAERLVTRGPAEHRRIALTFDDGPGPETEKFLALLGRYQVKGTFFMLGELAQLRPELARKVAAQGHEVATHTYNHVNYKSSQKALGGSESKAKQELLRDMQKAHVAIETAAQAKLRYCRMPYGIDRPWIRKAAAEMGYTLVNWTYGADWTSASAAELEPGYLKAIQPGAILLLHDGGNRRGASLAVTEAVIREARRQGYEIVTLGQLLNAPATKATAAKPGSP